MTDLDPRLNAYRKDLADIRLRGKVFAPRYVEGRPARICIPFAGMRGSPGADAPQTSQLLLGDDIVVFDDHKGWAWVQSARDRYVGYVHIRAVGPRQADPTHVVSVPRTFTYPATDIKAPRRGELPMGAQVTVVGSVEVRGTRYSILEGTDVAVSRHLRPLDETAPDYVGVAETLLYTPYLWGGATPFGIDCSGLVQLAMRMAGRDVPRDSDMQAASLGEPFEPGPGFESLRRGDLVFWKGHVAIMTDPDTILHANGYTMMVNSEPLAGAIARIEPLYGRPTGFRRP